MSTSALPDTLVTLSAELESAAEVRPTELLGGRRYTVGMEIARGGMGAILQTQEGPTKRQVAMKVMLETSGGDNLRRFIEEAQITAQLDHPNIVPIHELGVDEHGQPYYTMKLVRGITLKKVLKLIADGVEATMRKYPLPALLTVFQKTCDAVAFAHSKGVIHRDLKPENIMLGDFGSVLVMDWGLAKIVGHRALAGPDLERSMVQSQRSEASDPSLTISGSVLGTPQYMSPEQARGEVETCLLCEGCASALCRWLASPFPIWNRWPGCLWKISKLTGLPLKVLNRCEARDSRP